MVSVVYSSSMEVMKVSVILICVVLTRPEQHHMLVCVGVVSVCVPEVFLPGAAGLGDLLVEEILVPRVGGVAGEGSAELSLFGRIRPLFEYSVEEYNIIESCSIVCVCELTFLETAEVLL